MATKFYYLDELEEMKTGELREILDDADVQYSSEDSKVDLIRSILDYQTDSASCLAEEMEDIEAANEPQVINPMDDEWVESTQQTTSTSDTGGLAAVNASVSVSTNTETGDTSVGVAVSCGAASGNFPVVGKTISQVMTYLAEALNISSSSYPVVNGAAVAPGYVLSPGDVLEFVKTSGSKG